VSFDALIFIIWGAVSPFSIKSEQERLCLSDTADAYVGVLIAYKGILIIVGAILTFKIRKIPSGFNESGFIALAIYNALFLGAVWLAINFGFGSNLPEASRAVFDSGLTLFGAVSTITFLFGPKVYAIYSPNTAAKSFASSMVTARSGKTTAKSGHGDGSRKSGRDESSASVGDDGKSSADSGKSKHSDSIGGEGDGKGFSLDDQFTALQGKLEKAIRSIQKREEELTKAQEAAAGLAAELGEVNLRLQEGGGPNAGRTKELLEMAEKVRVAV